MASKKLEHEAEQNWNKIKFFTENFEHNVNKVEQK